MAEKLTMDQLAEKNRLFTGGKWIFLLEIALNDEAGTIVRLSSDLGPDDQVHPDNPKVTTWAGHDWTCFPFSVDDYTETSGDVPEFSVSVSNISKAMMFYVINGDGGIGAQATLHAVNSARLADGKSYFTHVATVLEEDDDDLFVKFTVGAENVFLTMIPRGRVLANFCGYTGMDDAYNGFRGARCGYSGSETTCDRTLTRCRELENSSRYGGKPGVGRTGVMYAS